MPKLIIGLTPHSYDFVNAVAHYCQLMDGPVTPERRQAIFFECLSQIFQKMDADAQRFALNLMELPVWTTIKYQENEFDYGTVEFFANAMRAFGLSVWYDLHSKDVLHTDHFYLLESCDTSVAIVGDYIDSSLV